MSGTHTEERSRRLRAAQARGTAADFMHRRAEALLLHQLGTPPSEIDEKMSMPEGMARELIVTHWADEREMRRDHA